MAPLTAPQAKELDSAPIALQGSGKAESSPSIGLRILQTIGYLALCIVFLEAFFYLACVGDGEHVYPDLKVGYKIFANKRITQRNEGFGCFKLNSFGMQNDEISVVKPAGVYRVAVFGDSYVESLQVSRANNYLNIFGTQLSKRLGRPVEVLNFGVSNYSVAQDYLRYQTLAKQFKPDLVVQVYRVEEIAKLLPMETQSLLFVRPVFFPDTKDKNALVYDNTCVRQFFQSKEGKRLLRSQWLRANSRIWGVVSAIWQQALAFQTQTQAALMPGKKGPNFTLPSDQTRANYAKCYWYMMEGQLTAFKNECTADGADFVFLRTPMVRPGMHTLTDNETETKLLDGTAAKLNVPLLNLDKKYRTWAGTSDDGTNFSAGGHFTPPLHAWVAGQVTAFLADIIKRQDK